MLAFTGTAAAQAPPSAAPGWNDIPTFEMRAGLEAYWDVFDRTEGAHRNEALKRGFQPVSIYNTFADYPGGQRENVDRHIAAQNFNPWNKPTFFERIIKRNIDVSAPKGLFVHDIEPVLERNPRVAWNWPELRASSGAADFQAFEDAYWKEWATWFVKPLQWTRERYPQAKIGIFGPQPFYKETMSVRTFGNREMERYHTFDRKLWSHIDPYVDFIVVENYIPTQTPDSIFYIALHLEENIARARKLSNKPVYSYQWLRRYSVDWRNKEFVEPYLVEAAVLTAYFSGATAVVLWGHEDTTLAGAPLPYPHLDVFVRALARIASVSHLIGAGTLVKDETAQALWKAQRPLLRKFVVPGNGCVVMAQNLWQSASEESMGSIDCAGKTVQVKMKGRESTLVHAVGGDVVSY